MPTGTATTTARTRRTAVILLAALLLALLTVFLPGIASADARPAQTAPSPATATEQPVTLTLFWGDGCPRCEAERAWIDTLADTYPTVTVEQHEVWKDAAGRELFETTAASLGFEASSVPTTVIGERAWIGWTDAIQADLETTLADAVAGNPPPAGVYGSHGTGTCSEEAAECVVEPEQTVIDLPIFGQVNLTGQNLAVSTLIIGFVDGINPCSLWAISVLLAITIRTASRGRVLAVGTTFLLITAGMYALYMVGLYSALTVVGYLGWVQGVVAAVAGVAGILSVKDYFAFKKGPSLTIKDSAKPGLYKRMRAAATHENLAASLGATVILAVGVSLLETPCTAGFPVLWTGLLQANGVGLGESAALFALYMVPFLLDEFLVFGAAVVTMRATKMQEKHGQILKLLAGVTMLVLAAVMALRPSIMEDPVTALALFAAAFVLTALIHFVTLRVRARTSATPPADTHVES